MKIKIPLEEFELFEGTFGRRPAQALAMLANEDNHPEDRTFSDLEVMILETVYDGGFRNKKPERNLEVIRTTDLHTSQ